MRKLKPIKAEENYACNLHSMFFALYVL